MKTRFAFLPALLIAAHAMAFERGSLAIESAGKRHEFHIEIATAPQDQAQGLMFRTELAPNAGMLFLYPEPRQITMWMKNTILPLDMLFIEKDGRISRIAERTVPQSLAVVSGGENDVAVLELNGGTASRLGLKPGDKVIYPGLGS